MKQAFRHRDHSPRLVAAMVGILVLLAEVPLATATFAIQPPLKELVDRSACILVVHVLATGEPLRIGTVDDWEEVMQINRCKVLDRIKISDDSDGIAHEAFDPILIASPSSRQIGRLEAGKKYIIFCSWGGWVPTVLGRTSFFEIHEGNLDRAIGDPRSGAGGGSITTANDLVKAIQEIMDKPGLAEAPGPDPGSAPEAAPGPTGNPVGGGGGEE